MDMRKFVSFRSNEDAIVNNKAIPAKQACGFGLQQTRDKFLAGHRSVPYLWISHSCKEEERPNF